MELAFERRAGVTVLTQRYASHPLAVQRAIRSDPAFPGLAHVHLLTTGAGILAGDRLAVTLRLGAGSHVLASTVGASRVHPAVAGRLAAQTTLAELGPDAILEWMPDALIPFGESRFTSHMEVRLDRGALLLACDVLAAGRIARGERWALAGLEQRLRLVGPGGRLLAAEDYRLRPRRVALTGPALLGGDGAVGTFRAVGTAVPAAPMVAALRQAVDGCPGVLAGATTLPGGAGVVLRAAGGSTEAVEAALQRAWDAARRLCLGPGAPARRRP